MPPPNCCHDSFPIHSPCRYVHLGRVPERISRCPYHTLLVEIGWPVSEEIRLFDLFGVPGFEHKENRHVIQPDSMFWDVVDILDRRIDVETEMIVLFETGELS